MVFQKDKIVRLFCNNVLQHKMPWSGRFGRRPSSQNGFNRLSSVSCPRSIGRGEHAQGSHVVEPVRRVRAAEADICTFSGGAGPIAAMKSRLPAPQARENEAGTFEVREGFRKQTDNSARRAVDCSWRIFFIWGKMGGENRVGTRNRQYCVWSFKI